MIADDAGFIREILLRLLIAEGHQVVAEAHQGIQAISLARQLAPELIFLDLVLPEMNGLEVAQEILKNNNQIAIVAMSAIEDESIHQEALNSGCRCFLQKPFSKAAVLQAIVTATQPRQDVEHGGA